MTESIRPEVAAFLREGPLPPSDSVGGEHLARLEDTLHKIAPPVTAAEAVALASAFGPEDDDCFGLAWTLLHLIETAPEAIDRLPANQNAWVDLIRGTAGVDCDRD